jgi:hypothetical protein
LRVQLCAGRYSTSILKQSPDQNSTWKNLEFVAAVEAISADWLVVYGKPAQVINTQVPKSKRILYISEPVAVGEQICPYICRFGTVVSPFPLPSFEGVHVKRHAARPWSFGASQLQANGSQAVLQWEDVADRDFDAKTGILSVVFPFKAGSEQARRHNGLIAALSRSLGDRFHIFPNAGAAWGGSPLRMSDFKYNLVIEDHLTDHCWTERLADAYLARCFPFFIGCSNLDEYFHPDAFEPIAPGDAEAAANHILRIVQEGIWEQRRTALLRAKEDVLFRYNILAEIEALVSRRQTGEYLPEAKGGTYRIPPDFGLERAILRQHRRMQLRRHIEHRRSAHV